jgi:hypothetical protein
MSKKKKIPAFDWKKWGKPRQNSLRVAELRAEI